MRRLALALLLVLPACSTGQEADGEASLEERRADYVAEVEERCAEANAELDATAQPASLQELPDYADTLVDLLRRTVQDVSTVEPPEEDRDEVTEKVLEPFADDVARAEEYAEQVRAASEQDDSATLLGLISDVPNTSADLAFMRDYGMVECAKAADTSD